jgi:uncharacterized protein (DUF924 family)
MDTIKPLEILKFWQNAGPAAWWRKDAEFDARINRRFGDFHQLAAKGEYDDWRDEAQSCLALVIVLDQFSRNLFRGSAKTFAQDQYGLELAQYAVAKGFDDNEPKKIYEFLYMPYMHSEKLEDQEACIELFRSAANKASLKAAIEHRDIIARFGRFPHRNNVLDRQTSPEEQTFLDGGGFSG